MADIKKGLKSIQTQLKDKNAEAALHEATTLLRSLNKDEPQAAQVLCFRGLALMHLQRVEEGEKCYIHAYRLQPGFDLAVKGLRKLYDMTNDWKHLARLLQTLIQDSYDSGNAEECASNLQELLEILSKHSPDQLYDILPLLLPSSPLTPFLQSLIPPANSYIPFQQPEYPASSSSAPSLPQPLPHALQLLGSLPLALTLLIRQQHLVNSTIESDVKSARMKLGAKSEKETRKDVEGKVLGGNLGSGMIELLREVSRHPSVDEEIRRQVEFEEFEYWRKLVGVLSSGDKSPDIKGKAKAVNGIAPNPDGKGKGKDSGVAESLTTLPPTPLFDPPAYSTPTKAEAYIRAKELADGFILLKLSGSAEAAYQWLLEGMDTSTIHYPLEFLHQYATLFRESRLAEFIEDYCRWFKLPPPPAEEEAKVDGSEEPRSDENKEETKAKKLNRKTRIKRKQTSNAKERRKARRQAGKDAIEEDFEEEEKEELLAEMTKAIDRVPKSLFVHRVMSRISMEEEDWANAVTYAEKARSLMKEIEIERGIELTAVKSSVDTALGVSLVHYYPPKHHIRSTRLLNGVFSTNPDDSEARFAKGQMFQYAQNWSQARKEFEQIIAIPEAQIDSAEDKKRREAAEEERGWCLVNEGRLSEGRDILEDVLTKREELWEENGRKAGEDAFRRARGWWRLGRTELLIGDEDCQSQAEEWFSASLRASPTYAPSFTSLGKIFGSQNDNERAFKCFQKAFELDATESYAAEKLARGYADDDEWTLVRAVCIRVMEGEGGVEGVKGGDAFAVGRYLPKNGWAWKALGATEVFHRNFGKAAQALQIALRALPEDVPSHVLLAEAYVKSGKQIAALKTLEKVLELVKGHWIARYMIGDIHFQLGNYEESIAVYEALNEEKKGEVGVMTGLTGSYLAYGRNMLAGGYRERAKAAFIKAIKMGRNVIQLGREWRSWGWKVIGDALFELNSLRIDAEDTQPVLLEILKDIQADDQDNKATVGSIKIADFLSGPEVVNFLLKSCVSVFQYRSHLVKNERPSVVIASLYDLATSLHILAGETKDRKEAESLRKSAIVSIREALNKDAGDERLWNALAVICGEGGAAIAQHAFIISLEIYEKDPITWTNLGYLYLKLDDRELANQCFLKAQIIDPDYAKAWYGQGLLAEKNGDRDHARNLFTHCVTLSAGSLLEADLAAAALSFERYLAPTMIDIGDLHQPAFALKHYIHQRPNDAFAIRLFGLIMERLGLDQDACTAFERSTNLFEQEFEQTESNESEYRYTVSLLNLARTRLSIRNYQAAAEAYEMVWELVSGSKDQKNLSMKVQSKLGLGLARYWLKETDQCLVDFEAAMHEAEISGIKGLKEEVAVLLAKTLWSLGEEGKELAKNHLMEQLASDTPSLKVISTLAAIALLTSDEDLIEATLSELVSSLPNSAGPVEQAQSQLVLTTSSLFDDQQETAMSQLSESLQRDPWNVKSRLLLAKLLTLSGKVEDALSLLWMDMRETEPELIELRGIARILYGDPGGLAEVQRSVRAQPWNTKLWDGLGWALERSKPIQ